MLRNIISIFLAVSLILSITACGAKDDATASSLPSSSAPSSSEDTSSEESSKNNSSIGNNYIGSGNFEGTKTPVTNSSEESSVIDTTTDVVVWQNPEVFSVIFPAGDSAVKQSALAVQKYFSTAYGVSLAVKSDTAAETPYEILVGKTNRKESDKNIAFSRFSSLSKRSLKTAPTLRFREV